MSIPSPLPKDVDVALTRLPPLGWVFVALALVVVWQRLPDLEYLPIRQIPSRLADGIEAIAVTLLPAALLFRTGDALRTHRVLLLGLMALAGAKVLERTGVGVSVIEPTFFPHFDPGLRITPDALLVPAGALLVGLGLLRLRPPRPTRPLLLVAILGLYVGLFLLGIAVASLHEGGVGMAPYDLAFSLVRSGAAAFAVWVAVGAWLDRSARRPFWALLAVALPLHAVESTAWTALWVASERVVAILALTIAAFSAAMSAVLALLAYARLTPIEHEG